MQGPPRRPPAPSPPDESRWGPTDPQPPPANWGATQALPGGSEAPLGVAPTVAVATPQVPPTVPVQGLAPNAPLQRTVVAAEGDPAALFVRGARTDAGGLDYALAAFLGYLLPVFAALWMLGERRDKPGARWLRFHAVQSLAAFGAAAAGLNVVGLALYLAGFGAVLWLLWVAYWVVIAVVALRAYNGETLRLPLADALAAKYA